MDREMTVKHDGALHKVMVRGLAVEQCENCGKYTVGNVGDAQIDAALRAHLKLMAPEEIRARRKHLDLTQEAMAQALGCASETISRWESGTVVQSPAYDRWMRAYFALPVLRAFFAGLASPSAGINIPVPLAAHEPTPGVRGDGLVVPVQASISEVGELFHYVKPVTRGWTAATAASRASAGSEFPRLVSYDKKVA